MVAATGERLIFEISARDSWWRSQPTGNRYEGKNVLGRRCMEVCQQLRDDDQAARSDAWISRIRVVALLPGAMAFRPPPFRRHPLQPHSRHPVSPTRTSLPEERTGATNTRPRPRGGRSIRSAGSCPDTSRRKARPGTGRGSERLEAFRPRLPLVRSSQ